ncbi:acyltransferase family protein [Streptomyces sp. NPDC002845]
MDESQRVMPRGQETRTADRADRPPAEPPRGGFRGDVEGLRAVAVAAVLLYHADVTLLSGGYIGVDVFFVVSGFLITGLLVRELERSGTISLSGFYARRARRLLPVTVVVLASVLLLSWLVMSPVERRSVSSDVVAAALYVINWRLAGEAVDYSALEAQASPVQHFWSLAVEEQFYLVWPLLLLAIAWWCRRRGGLSLRPRLAVALGAIAVASFTYSVFLTQREAGAAYFSTATRGWELAAGGLLALVPAHRLRRPGRVPGMVAFGGLAAIVAAAVLFNDGTRFPGPGALLPVLGTVAVIAAGSASADTATARLLMLRPVRYVGRISYSWYLWHWPAIVLATAWLSELPPSLSLLVVALSWVPAALTHRLVEERFRRSPRFEPVRPALGLGAACTTVSVLVGSVSWSTVPTVQLASPAEAKGAKALRESTAPQESASALRPVPEKATEDRGQVHDDGCLVDQPGTRSPECVYGDRSSDTTVVLFGDSHAMQYTPALDIIAKERGWRLVVLTKSACTPAQVPTYNSQLKREYTECDTWRDHTLRRIDREDPSMIVTGNLATTKVVRDGEALRSTAGAEALTDGYADTLRTLRSTGAQVVTLADNPHPPDDIPACVSKELDNLTECAFSEDDGRSFDRVNVAAAQAVDEVELVDPTPMLCPNGTCPAVIGNVIVYRNGAHITASYMRTLDSWLGNKLPVAL